jgi:peptidoglycan-N-acetylglucosamine deacetylase
MKKFLIPLSILILAFTIFVILWQVSKARTFQSFGRLVHRVDTQKKIVALTFDDGPTAEITPAILDILAKENARATFFIEGSGLEKNMDSGRQIVAAGHELGNHSYSHERMIFVSPSYVEYEVERTDALIREAGHQGPIYFRPPYSRKLFVLPYYLSKTGRTTVTCDIEADSNSKATADEIARATIEQTRPGSIILLHVMYQSRAESLKAVPKIIDELRSKGYEFVTVSELLAQ